MGDELQRVIVVEGNNCACTLTRSRAMGAQSRIELSDRGVIICPGSVIACSGHGNSIIAIPILRACC